MMHYGIDPKRGTSSLAGRLTGVPFALVYALGSHFLFQTGGDASSLVTLGFLCGVPFGVGVLTMLLARGYCNNTLAAAMFPVLSTILYVAILGIAQVEAFICICLALPLVILMSSLGGLFTCAMFGFRGRTPSNSRFLGLFIFLPYLFAPLEGQWTPPTTTYTVNTAIIIDAPVEVVWQNIVRVPTIQTWERRPAFFTAIGLPYPIEATLSGEGIGSVRHASFEEGLLFIETVTLWEDNRAIAFTIEADKSVPLPAHLQMIDSPYFEVIDGGYVIEPLADGRVLLHLSSQHEVTTTFNWYAGLWTRLIMSDIQNNILQIIKTRSESLVYQMPSLP